ALGDSFYTAQVLDDLGWSSNLSMQPEKHVDYVQKSLELRRAIGDKYGIANALRNLGGSSGGFFEPTGASFNYWQEAKTLSYELHDWLGVAWNAALQATNLIYRGEFDAAVILIDEAYPHAVNINDPVVKGLTIGLQGLILAL